MNAPGPLLARPGRRFTGVALVLSVSILLTVTFQWVIPEAHAHSHLATQEHEATPLTLYPGVWNHIVWSGPDTGLAAVFKVIPEARIAAVWNAEQKVWTYQVGNSAASFPLRNEFHAVRPLKTAANVFVWVSGTEPIVWLPGTYTKPKVIFDSAFSAAQQQRALDEIHSIIAFFAERYGLWVSDLLVTYPFPGECTFSYELETDRPWIHAFLNLNEEEWSSCFAHEYGHALHLGRPSDGLGFFAPEWMIEGAAEYFASESWNDWQNEFDDYDSYFDLAILPKLLDPTDPWPEPYPGLGEPSRALSQIAIKHLVGMIGERVFVDRMRAPLPSRDRPEICAVCDPSPEEVRAMLESQWFENAFGVSLDQFYRSFEAYRRTLGDPVPTFSGVVVDEMGRPVPGVHVDLIQANGYWYTTGITDSDGSFQLSILGGEGAYGFSLILDDDGGYGVTQDYRWGVCAFQRHEDDGGVSGVLVDLSKRPGPDPEFGLHAVPTPPTGWSDCAGAEITDERVTTTPPETGTATGLGSSEESPQAANEAAVTAARNAVPSGATVTGTPTASAGGGTGEGGVAGGAGEPPPQAASTPAAETTRAQLLRPRATGMARG